eukprot:3937063-Pyramimonas_sp.AAC.1
MHREPPRTASARRQPPYHPKRGLSSKYVYHCTQRYLERLAFVPIVRALGCQPLASPGPVDTSAHDCMGFGVVRLFALGLVDMLVVHPESSPHASG